MLHVEKHTTFAGSGWLRRTSPRRRNSTQDFSAGLSEFPMASNDFYATFKLAAPLDVYAVGRMAVLQHPTGAVFSVRQAKRDSGFGIKGVPGTFCVADLSTPDQDAASGFYGQLFVWTTGKEDEDPAHKLLPSLQSR
jgi:hypothetical protein